MVRLVALALVLVGSACTLPSPPRESDGSAGGSARPSTQPKVITAGLTVYVRAMAPLGSINPVGGLGSLLEVASAGLVSSDVETRQPVPRLAARLPSLEDGTIALLPDGQLRVTYALRKDVTWQDRTPFTAHDLAFSHRLLADRGLPLDSGNRLAKTITSLVARDDHTADLLFPQPYTPARGHEIAATADFWRRIGIEVDEQAPTAAQFADLQNRATYPGWSQTGRGTGDDILNFFMEPPASAETRWTGERSGYDDARTRALIGQYWASLDLASQLQAMKAISDLLVSEVHVLPLYYHAYHLTVRKGVRALDDWRGGMSGHYGSYSRNAHLWEVE